jgi:hypothetical protein
MAHLHVGIGEHDHTVSAYLVRTDGREPRILLHLHKSLGRYLQFGGHIELTENPWQAVEHELREESGYCLDQLGLLQPKERITSLASGTLHPVPLCYNTHQIGLDHWHSDASWAFVTSQEPRFAVAEGESSLLRWFSADDLDSTLDHPIEPSVRDVALFLFRVVLDRWEVIPADRW